MKPLYNDCREAMSKTGHIKAALLVDALYFHSLNPGEWVTVKDVSALLPDTSEYTIRNGLNDGVVFRTRKVKSGKAGQPQREYKVPDRDYLRNVFVEPEKQTLNFCDALPELAFIKVSEYRLFMHYRFIQRQLMTPRNGWEGDAVKAGMGKEEVRFPMDFLAKRIGVCKSTIRKYNQRAKVITEKRCDATLLGSIEQVPEQSLQGRKYLATGDWLEIIRGGGIKAPFIRGVAALWKAQKRKVYIVEQGINAFTIRPDQAAYIGAGRFEYEASRIMSANFGVEAVAA